MIKLSTRCRYALRALVDLVENSKKTDKAVALKEIADRQNISIKYLEALFTVMKSAGIVNSLRGAKGGYFLAKNPKKITAMEVIKAIEGPISIVGCTTTQNYCDNIKKCKTVKLWKRLNDLIVSELRKTTVQDMI